LSRLSRRDDLELGVAVTSIHRTSDKVCSRKLISTILHETLRYQPDTPWFVSGGSDH
jgi:hypothetical protein